MKPISLVVAVFVATLAAGSAEAGNPFASTPGVWDWDGPYFGANGGGSWGQSRWTAGPLTTGDFSVDGGMGGLTFGYDWQRQHWVFGTVADIDLASISGTTSNLCHPPCSTSNNFMATLRGRFGYEFGQFMPYVTGGLALGGVTASFRPPFTGEDSELRVGYAVGAGAESQFARSWSWWIEYLFEDLGNGHCSSIVCAGPPTATSTLFQTSTVRIGFNRRF